MANSNCSDPRVFQNLFKSILIGANFRIIIPMLQMVK